MNEDNSWTFVLVVVFATIVFGVHKKKDQILEKIEEVMTPISETASNMLFWTIMAIFTGVVLYWGIASVITYFRSKEDRKRMEKAELLSKIKDAQDQADETYYSLHRVLNKQETFDEKISELEKEILKLKERSESSQMIDKVAPATGSSMLDGN